jgi:hypothetical protein
MLITYRLNIAEAKAKLEILKALDNNDPDLSFLIFVNEVEVAMLVGDPERVRSS